MSYGLIVKNKRGEIVTDSIGDIGQHITSLSGTVAAYNIIFKDMTDISNSLNLSYAVSVTDFWASPYFRRYDEYVVAYNRLWMNNTPPADYDISILNVGLGEEDTGGSVYGFKTNSNNSTSIVNSNSRTLRWIDGIQDTFTGSTVSGVHNGWIINTSYDYSAMNLKTPPYFVISPTDYQNITDGAEYSRFAFAWYCSTTHIYIGTHLWQTAGFSITIPDRTYQIAMLTLD